MRTVKVLFFLLISSVTFAQTNSISGNIIGENGEPLTSSTVVLLNPADSTMQYFGISNSSGLFEIKNIKQGNYLMQIAFIGYQTIYKNISFPVENGGDLGFIPMIPKPVSLDEVTVTGERIPLKIKQDTIEYDARAFKVTPDAVVEDLLKILPGIEVDRAGNIKALGEDVNTILVDGKEFFSNDPKLATKNLPADALEKVQVYNKKSDESEFTGIDDGARNQTINLVLDEDKKDGLFGELMAGGGSGSHYQANAKVYNFSEKTQMAALGMINNVNKFGFSINDYLSFTGGIAKFSHGGGGMTLGGGGFPINFGETITGYSSSGAGGVNYSYSKSKSQRFFISYLGNGSKRELEERTKTTSYRETDSFFQEDNTSQVQRDTSHSVNFGTRYLFRKTNNIIINGGVSLNTGYIPLTSTTSSYLNGLLMNDMTRVSSDLSDRLSGNISGTYLKRINEGKTILKLSGNSAYSSSNSETIFENNIRYYNPDISELVNQFQNNGIKSMRYGGSLSFTQKIFNKLFMDLSLSVTDSDESLIRRPGDSSDTDIIIDTLSPEFEKIDRGIRPGISLRRNSEKSTLTLAMEYNIGEYNTTLWEDNPVKKTYKFFQPRLSWEYEYKTGRRLIFKYSSRVNTPSVNQLLPVVNNFNSLSLFYGNRDLNPEFIHSFSANWWIFDQFSFTTMFTTLYMSYTTDKINYERTVSDQLGQIVKLVNVDSDFSVNGGVDFSTPIRPLGIKTNINIRESYNRGINIVDGIENEITNLSHRLSLTFDNRKKEKWDINIGTGLTMTDARYSIQESLNNVYFDISWFGEIRYTPNKKFEFKATADVTNYTAQSFEESQVIPLIGTDISYFFMKNNRAALTLSGFDLLNRNTGISRTSEMNYLRERQSNIIGRYVMLSFKYRLNKFGGGNPVDIKIKKH
ncbi:MAG: outer membrane beta-barrel protein [Bacteroidales bacterium]|nr:outer membrane beta-barrel protein [Bacteroidales bacterium]